MTHITHRSAAARTSLLIAATILLAAGFVPFAGAASANAPLSSYLLRSGEATGFVPGSQHVVRNLEKTLKQTLELKGRKYETERKRLEGEGWLGIAYESMSSKREAKGEGISSVYEFRTPAGARAEMSFERHRDTDPTTLPKNSALHFYKVPGVPRVVAFEFTGTKTGETEAAADALFVEGRCMITIGDFTPSGKAKAPVAAGVKALYARTKGTCP